MGYQGLFPPDTLPLLTLPWDLFTIAKMEFFGQVNFLKGALVFSDFVTTVSRKYTPGNSDRRVRLWPGRRAARPLLDRCRNPERRGLRRVEPADRQVHRRQLLALGSERQGQVQAGPADHFRHAKADSRLPVIGIVSRFAAQKGFDLIAQIMERLAREEMIMVALGSGDKVYEEMFLRLVTQFPQKIAVKGRLRQRRRAQDRSRQRHVSDAIQIRTLRTEPDLQPEVRHRAHRARHRRPRRHHRALGCAHRKGTGFKFADYNGEALLLTIKEALRAFRDQTSWQTLMRNGMSKDFSWNASAREYVKIYERVRQLKGAALATV